MAMVSRRPLPLRLLMAAFVVFWLILAAFPFFWTVWGSFKVELDFFSITDWTNALTGERTLAAHGSAFTGDGYYGALSLIHISEPTRPY